MRIVCLLLLFVSTISTKAQLIINELMQSNVDCIMDDLNDFPDSWVEIYNVSDSTVDLSNYQIGDNLDTVSAYRMPEYLVAPHAYVLVCCDKVGSGLHTNFRLNSGKGGAVYLYRDGQIIDYVIGLKKQPAPNIAWGRIRDASEQWGYMLKATPGAQNCGTEAEGVLSTPIFSTPGQILSPGDTLQLRLSLPEGAPLGTVIRYTTNGSEPSDTSKFYDEPIVIDESTVIRARLFCNGWLSSPSLCHSYIFFPNDRPLTLPVVSIVTDDRYLNDSLIGINTEGCYKNGKANYNFNWRRPVNIELFETINVSASLNQLCETRIFGASSRQHKLRSLVVYAHKRFGTKHFEYEFFPDQRPGITDYKSIVLRNAGNDYHNLYMRDAICQRNMAQHTDLDWQAWRPSIVYFNGNYMGILNIRDRSNEDNVYSHHGGIEDIDLISNYNILEEGTMDNFNAFRSFYSESGHTMEEYEQWMDCHEFLNLMVMNIYHANWDFPGNNSIMWRPRTEGGRWRFIAKDVDSGLGLYNLTPDYDYIEWLYNVDYDSTYYWGNRPAQTLLFRQLMEDESFRQKFIDHFAVYMGDFLNDRGIRAVWNAMYDKVKTELPFHRKLNSRAWNFYEEEMARVRIWLARRSAIVYSQLAIRYRLGTPIPLAINKFAAANLKIKINGVPLTSTYFDGMFFAGRQITVEAKDSLGNDVMEWRIKTTSDNDTVTQHDIAMPVLSFVMPQCETLQIEPITDIDDGIKTAFAGQQRFQKKAFDLQGRQFNVYKAAKGIYIIDGRKYVK